MIITLKILKELIDYYYNHYADTEEYNDESLPCFLYARLTNIQEIKRKICNCNTEINNARKQCKDKIEKLKEEIKLIRKSCNHIDFSFYGDPAGGSDSFNKCNICGEEW